MKVEVAGCNAWWLMHVVVSFHVKLLYTHPSLLHQHVKHSPISYHCTCKLSVRNMPPCVITTDLRVCTYELLGVSAFRNLVRGLRVEALL